MQPSDSSFRSSKIDTGPTVLTLSTPMTETRHADVAYAPPFSPVWDPILTTAKVLEGS
jgi:hypothetical protein